jgi:integrase
LNVSIFCQQCWHDWLLTNAQEMLSCLHSLKHGVSGHLFASLEGFLVRSPLDLLNTFVTSGSLASSRAKDIKTALRKLADAYETDIDGLDLASIETTYLEMLRTYFAQCAPVPSAHTQRNTIQNLKQLYRLLHESGIIQQKRVSTVQYTNHRAVMAEGGKTSPYRSRTSAALAPFYCRLPQWPAAIREPWERYCASKTFEIRPSTVEMYTRTMTPYVSYGLNIERPPITTWDELFDPVRIGKFITWHAQRVGASRISSTGFMVIRLITDMAKQEQRPEAGALLALKKKLPAVQPFHNKQASYHTISASELEGVGLKLLAQARQPIKRHGTWHANPGLMRALHHRTSLLIRLMWRLPLRSRSLREMEIPKNLFQDAEGVWWVRYVGEELKVSERNGRTNVFQVPWPAELTEHLEEYLREYRPRFPNADIHPHVFLTYQHGPFSVGSFYQCIAHAVYLHLRKRLYPHLLRTLWVDQYLLSSGGDVSTAAYILNDTVATVLKRYHELRGADHVQKAYAFNQAILGNGKAH